MLFRIYNKKFPFLFCASESDTAIRESAINVSKTLVKHM
uniref:Uncharacterized protein n=1 Tax=Anguilla anguilla TaxID=7936 RepID=A0A0E9TYJ5_ANGAN